MSYLGQWQIGSGGPMTQYFFNGVALGAPGSVSTVNFTGAGVTAAQVGAALTVTIPGGGAGLPTIPADVTINVPVDYPTINDALDFVRSAVRLNGALVTIAVDGAAYTPNEQIVINAEDLEYVTLQASAPVTIDSTGFALSPLGVAIFIAIQGAGKLGPVLGSWTKGGAVNCCGVASLNNSIAQVSGTLDGFEIGIAAATSKLSAGAISILNSTSASVFNAGVMDINTPTINGAVGLQCFAGSSLTIQNGSMTTTGGCIFGLRADINISGLTVDAGAVDSPINVSECNADIQLTALTCDPATRVILNNRSDLSVRITTLNNAATLPNDFVQNDGGSTFVHVNGFGASNVSGGQAVLGNNASFTQVQDGATLATFFTAGYNPVELVPAAAGLTLA